MSWFGLVSFCCSVPLLLLRNLTSSMRAKSLLWLLWLCPRAISCQLSWKHDMLLQTAGTRDSEAEVVEIDAAEGIVLPPFNRVPKTARSTGWMSKPEAIDVHLCSSWDFCCDGLPPFWIASTKGWWQRRCQRTVCVPAITNPAGCVFCCPGSPGSESCFAKPWDSLPAFLDRASLSKQ